MGAKVRGVGLEGRSDSSSSIALNVGAGRFLIVPDCLRKRHALLDQTIEFPSNLGIHSVTPNSAPSQSAWHDQAQNSQVFENSDPPALVAETFIQVSLIVKAELQFQPRNTAAVAERIHAGFGRPRRGCWNGRGRGNHEARVFAPVQMRRRVIRAI
jgi:hypothetical protein